MNETNSKICKICERLRMGLGVGGVGMGGEGGVGEF